jgi:hypothetical protein
MTTSIAPSTPALAASGREGRPGSALAPRSLVDGRTARTARAARLAGSGFVAAWLVGLVVNPSGPAIDATDGEVAAHYASHGMAALASELLIHGVAAVCLAVVVTAVVAHARRTGRPFRLFRATGYAAAGVSAVQVLAGTAAVAATGATFVGTMFDTLDRLDGVKLLLLSVAVFASIRILGGWAARVAFVLLVTLFLGGLGYLFLQPALALAAGPALLLLLVWVASSARTAAGAR